MCAIGGFYAKKELTWIESVFVDKLMKEIIMNASRRGRDSAGIVIKSNSGIRNLAKIIGHPKKLLNEFNITMGDRAAIFNTRAEPTTEYVKNKTEADVQPFHYTDTYMVHNGTVANDHEILQHCKESLPTKVDSYALPFYISKNYHAIINSGTLESPRKNVVDNELSKIKIVGSLSVAFFREFENDLYLYKNYNPISVFYLPAYETYVFVSLPEMFTEAVAEFEGLIYQEVTFKPYSQMRLSKHGHHITDTDTDKNDKAVVILSGGLDSTTVAQLAAMKHEEVILAHFHYGCQAQTKETVAVHEIHKRLLMQTFEKNKKIKLKRIAVELFDLDFIKNLGGNALTDHTMQIAQGEAGAEFAHEWVPARNLVFASMIAAYCDRWNIGHIYMGLNLEESGAYPDNTIEFYRTLNQNLQFATKARPVIHNPLDCLMKHEIVKLGLHIHAPIDLSWSCYAGGEKPCGKCGPCFMRSRAFKMNGVIDMLEYETLPQEWDECEPFVPNMHYEISDDFKELMKEWL